MQTNTHLYTSEALVSDFIGRVFKVKAVYDYRTFIKQNTIRKANVITRNFPHPPEELKKKHKINDGGEEFLIFTTVYPDKLTVISAIINQ